MFKYGVALFYTGQNTARRGKNRNYNHHSQLEKLLGVSGENPYLVSNVQNLSSGYIYPQYPVIFDDLFQTVCGLGEDEVVTGTNFNQLSEHDWFLNVEEEFLQDSELIYSAMPLDVVWVDEA